MKDKRCLIFGAVSFRDAAFIHALIRPDDLILAADAGLCTARAAGVTPHVWIGDGDSLNGQPPFGIKSVRLPEAKDMTDTQACLDYGLAAGCRTFFLVGGTGGARLDHTLANLALLEYAQARGATLTLIDENIEARLVRDTRLLLAPPHRFGYFSVFPLDETARVSERGAAFPLDRAILRRDTPLGVSNRPLPGHTVEIDISGKALIVFSERTSF